jgi:hypothetical protein
LEAYLGRYSGLMLYLREMDESAYGKICGVIIYFLSSIVTISPSLQAYFSAASDLHNTQIKALLSTYLDSVKKATEEEIEQGKSEQKCIYLFESKLISSVGSMTIPKPATLRRAGTVVKSPKERDKKTKTKWVEISGPQRCILGKRILSERFNNFLGLHHLARANYCGRQQRG